MAVAPIKDQPKLPAGCGPLSTAVCGCFTGPAPTSAHFGAIAGSADPYGRDLQLALYICYELHYRGFAGVDPAWEWNPALLQLRAHLERVFLAQMRADVGHIPQDATAAGEMDMLSAEPVEETGVTSYLRDSGSWEQVREYFVHRSLYHLKEGDPHAWAIPRLTGQAKASFVAVEFDEYGAGRGPQIHQQLYADLMVAAGLDATYLGYLEVVPAEALAVVNLMSLFGLHRRWRGAVVGHFAATEITSPPGSRRLVAALQRLQAPEPCVAFYREHVEADAVHEQVVRSEVVDDLINREPYLQRDVVFGMRARDAVEDLLAEAMMNAWNAGQPSLEQRLQ